VDYQIPKFLELILPQFAVTQRELDFLTVQMRDIRTQEVGWRRKLRQLIPLISPAAKERMMLTEYKVYPRNSVTRCKFREAVARFRSRPKDRIVFNPDIEAPRLDFRRFIGRNP
jgi:hypothetical protein